MERETVQREVSILKDSISLLFPLHTASLIPLAFLRAHYGGAQHKTELGFRLDCHLHAEVFPAFIEKLLLQRLKTVLFPGPHRRWTAAVTSVSRIDFISAPIYIHTSAIFTQ